MQCRPTHWSRSKVLSRWIQLVWSSWPAGVSEAHYVAGPRKCWPTDPALFFERRWSSELRRSSPTCVNGVTPVTPSVVIVRCWSRVASAFAAQVWEVAIALENSIMLKLLNAKDAETRSCQLKHLRSSSSHVTQVNLARLSRPKWEEPKPNDVHFYDLS